MKKAAILLLILMGSTHGIVTNGNENDPKWLAVTTDYPFFVSLFGNDMSNDMPNACTTTRTPMRKRRAQ